MKLLPYKNLFVGITSSLTQIFFHGKYADREVERTLKINKKWGSRDRSFVAETIYECVRWKRRLEAGLGENLSPENLWDFVGIHFLSHGISLPDWEEFSNLKEQEILQRIKIATEQSFAVKESIPDWLNYLGEKELGKEKWQREIEEMNHPSPTVIRVNTLKTNREKLKIALQKEKIASRVLEEFPDALILTEKSNIQRTKSFKAGWFEIQDADSQLIAPFLQTKPGMTVIDACAGAGGKTLHLAAEMKNKGEIIAMDIFKWKLKELKNRAYRNGVKIIRTQLIDSFQIIENFKEYGDCVLIDAPCTGLGVLARNPDTKWKLTPEFLEEIKTTQQEILNDYSIMVKPGGTLVYATCSILPSENQNQVKKFLENHSDFKLKEEKRIFPSEYNFDGFYMARLLKTP